MAILCVMNDIEFHKWTLSRPKIVQKLIKRLPPNRLYRLASTGHRVTIYSYSEDGTVTVNVTGQFNLIPFERSVFGISPDDLTECDLPAEGEKLGVLLNDEQTLEFINSERQKLGVGPLTMQELEATRG